MRDIYQNIRTIAAQVDQAIVLFSCGKDSTVMLDLFAAYMKGKITVVHLYYVKGLEFHEQIIRHYQQKYGIEIQQHPHPEVAVMDRRSKANHASISQGDAFLRERYEISFLAYGYRKDESLERRGMLKHTENGIDWKFRKLYPLAEWKQADIEKYVKARKLLQSPEYAWGYRDIHVFKGEPLLWIKSRYPEDYERIVARFPHIEGELLRAEEALA